MENVIVWLSLLRGIINVSNRTFLIDTRCWVH